MSNSIKKLNRLVNADLNHLVNWLNANKISLNLKKLKWWSLNLKQKKLEGDLKIKLWGERLYPTESVKCQVQKLTQTLVGNMLMICPLNWIEQMHSFSKWENMLGLKY